MRKKSRVFVGLLICISFNLLAMDQSGDEQSYKQGIKQKTIEHHSSHKPMNYWPDLCSCWTVGGVAAGIADFGTGCAAILPAVVNCILPTSPLKIPCEMAAALGGALGGFAFITSMGCTVFLGGARYYQVNEYNNRYQQRVELLKVIETSFNYDDVGPSKPTPLGDSETVVLIEDPNNDLLHRMINNYHTNNPSYKITVSELAKRIRAAVFAGYFTPRELLCVQDKTGAFGKWVDLTIHELMAQLAIEKSGLKKYYETCEQDFKKLFEYEGNVKQAKQIEGPVFDLDE
ncbi:MAG TPA: hypothetical protein VEL47_07540 [Myxococcota bacterium]|nr:hypothetical protein [Myxococcota bacterium]